MGKPSSRVHLPGPPRPVEPLYAERSLAASRSRRWGLEEGLIIISTGTALSRKPIPCIGCYRELNSLNNIQRQANSVPTFPSSHRTSVNPKTPRAPKEASPSPVASDPARDRFYIYDLGNRSPNRLLVIVAALVADFVALSVDKDKR